MSRTSVATPRQRVRVPMPVQTPLTKPEGLISDPWLYYLMQSRIFFSNTGFILAMCEDLAVGDDLHIHYPVTLPGTSAFVGFSVKTPPADGAEHAIIDLQKSSDSGVTWKSMFLPEEFNRIVLEPGALGVGILYGTWSESGSRMNIGDLIRVDCDSTPAGVRGVALTLYWALDDFETNEFFAPAGAIPAKYNFPEPVL